MIVQDERLRKLVTEKAAEWFVENRSGALSSARKREFVRWLRASPLHVAEYLSIAGIARDVGAASKHVRTPVEQLLAEAAAEDVATPLHPEKTIKQLITPERRQSRWRPAWKPLAAAAVICLIFAIGVWTWWSFQTDAGRQYVTRYGEKRTFALADHTVIHLDAASAIRVDFDENRRFVEIERGQALFEVTKNPARPFRVRAGNSVIEDVGTVFDVNRQHRNTVVTVLEGQVSVSRVSHQPMKVSIPSSTAERVPTAALRPHIDLRAGDQANIAPSGAVETRHDANLRKTTAWLQAQIVFDHESIAAVAAKFNRHNKIQIEVTDPRIASMPISGVFHTYDVQSFADFLNALKGVQAVMVDNELRVSSIAPSRLSK
jgi:transmembrane sensor